MRAMAAGAAELVTGERAVVLLFVFRVVLLTPFSLLPEAAALALLAAAGIAVEIAAENRSPLHGLKTRPGASSGILLGAVTLPAAMLSRCISLSRAISHTYGESQEISQLHMEYWAASACCFGVLIFLGFRQSLGLRNSRTSNFSLFGLVLYLSAAFVSFETKLHNGLQAAINLVWLFGHGMATVKLIQYILRTFPSCASIGEALLVSSGLVLCIGDMLGSAISKISLPLSPYMQVSLSEHGDRNEILVLMQGVFLGLLVFPTAYKVVLHIWISFVESYRSEEQEHEMQKNRDIKRSLLFYVSLTLMISVIVPLWLKFFQDFHAHPMEWIINFVLSEPVKRMTLCAYWICVICTSILRFYNISKQSKIERILLRKYYHLVAVLMFVPALLFQSSFLDLAFGAALAVFVVLEMIRVWKIWPLGNLVHHFMNAFTDHRDSEILIVSHFSLLLGCALPKWMSSGLNDRPLAPYAGILSLGIGDTMASMVGHKYGVLRWSKFGKKTIEGTAAGITSVLAACSILLPLIASSGYIFLSQHWLSLLLAVIVSGLLEAFTTQLDNAFIPLVFYSLLCL